MYHIGFFASGADGNLFIYRHGGHLVFLLLYVDDIILTGNDSTFTTSIIQLLSSAFDLKDLGLLHYLLGLQIEYTASGLFVHQSKYATNFLSSLPCKIVSLAKHLALPISIYFLMIVLPCLILLLIEVWLVLSNTLHLLDLTSPLLFNKPVSI